MKKYVVKDLISGEYLAENYSYRICANHTYDKIIKFDTLKEAKQHISNIARTASDNRPKRIIKIYL